MVQAQGNWWGDASGPGGEGSGSGDKVSAGVNFEGWRTEMVSLVVAAAVDTLFSRSGSTDSVNVFFRNWRHPTEEVAVSITDAQGWLQGETNPARS